jgi:4-hydroxyphenylacetate 3-monooxygenase
MPARSGSEFIQRLRDTPTDIWHRGQRIDDVTRAPGFANGIASLAELFDLQLAEADTLTFKSPETGDAVGRSFQIPESQAELVQIGDAMLRTAQHSMGMLGREPAYLNRAVSSYAGGAAFLNAADPRFGENAIRQHARIRELDLSLTHTLINPQINRAVGPAHQSDPYLSARIREERDDGFIVRGARMLATLPIADEIVVFPSTLLRSADEDAPYAFGFVIPSNTPGLKFICRESLDYGGSHYDHPLGSRFEEMDALVIFDDVLVPWERVYLYRDVEICNQAFTATSAVVNMAHQVVCKNIAKTEYLLGLVALMVESIGIDRFQHIHEKVAEVWVNLETLKAFRRTAELDATLNDFGVMTPAWDPLDAARNLQPRLYPRMIEIIQQIGASGLVAMPTAADVDGPMKAEIERYYQSAHLEAKDRIPLFRLAWDTAISAFAGRQVLYERFFFGDPVRMAGAIFHRKDMEPYKARVRDFLEERVKGDS